MEKGFEFAYHESLEVDIAPIPENESLSDLISGTIGELSPFHQTFGYYADGCDISTAIFPTGWEQRVINYTFEGDIDVYFPSAEDLAFSKYIAGRGKDLEFIKKLWADDLLQAETMERLIPLLPVDKLAGKFGYVKSSVMRDIRNYRERARSPEVEP